VVRHAFFQARQDFLWFLILSILLILSIFVGGEVGRTQRKVQPTDEDYFRWSLRKLGAFVTFARVSVPRGFALALTGKLNPI
jgi:hypothetical protein